MVDDFNSTEVLANTDDFIDTTSDSIEVKKRKLIEQKELLEKKIKSDNYRDIELENINKELKEIEEKAKQDNRAKTNKKGSVVLDESNNNKRNFVLGEISDNNSGNVVLDETNNNQVLSNGGKKVIESNENKNKNQLKETVIESTPHKKKNQLKETVINSEKNKNQLEETAIDSDENKNLKDKIEVINPKENEANKDTLIGGTNTALIAAMAAILMTLPPFGPLLAIVLGLKYAGKEWSLNISSDCESNSNENIVELQNGKGYQKRDENGTIREVPYNEKVMDLLGKTILKGKDERSIKNFMQKQDAYVKEIGECIEKSPKAMNLIKENPALGSYLIKHMSVEFANTLETMCNNQETQTQIENIFKQVEQHPELITFVQNNQEILNDDAKLEEFIEKNQGLFPDQSKEEIKKTFENFNNLCKTFNLQKKTQTEEEVKGLSACQNSAEQPEYSNGGEKKYVNKHPSIKANKTKAEIEEEKKAAPQSQKSNVM